MGDVFIAAIATRALALAYPGMKITFLGPERLKPVFDYMPSNVSYYGILPKGLKKWGYLKDVADSLRAKGIDAVCDFHHTRSTVHLDAMFFLRGIPVSLIRRKGISNIFGRKKRLRTPQKSPVILQKEALERLGLHIDITSDPGFFPAKIKEGPRKIGIAPFASKMTKTYPLDRMEEVIKGLSERGEKVFLFGAPGKEQSIMEGWAAKYPGVESTAGKPGSVADEMELISKMSVMLTMDSANMHLSVLAGTPVVSIWGATHPNAGFLGWGLPLDSALCNTSLPCCPCSSVGNKPCRYGDYRCFDAFTPASIIDRLLKY